MLFKLPGIGRTVITAIIIYNKSIHVVTGICYGILKVFFCWQCSYGLLAYTHAKISHLVANLSTSSVCTACPKLSTSLEQRC
jgi:hypothetical protein